MKSRRKPPLWRKRVLKRGAWFHVLSNDDLKWLWAQYRLGSFEGYLDEGYSEREFDEAIYGLVNYFIKSHEDVAYILEGYYSPQQKTIPMGLVVLNIRDDAAWPTVIWFKTASLRVMIETSVAFLQEIVRDKPVLFIAKEDETQFLSHLGRYGLLTRLTKIKQYNDESRYLHYGKRK